MNIIIVFFLAFVQVCSAFTAVRNFKTILSINTLLNERKPGVSSPEELRKFVNNAGSKLIVIDVREPDDVIMDTPCKCNRPRAINAVWDRASGTMNLPVDFPKDTPIITHCNSGGRGQKACEYLISQGYTNVINGGGPLDEDCWGIYGDL